MQIKKIGIQNFLGIGSGEVVFGGKGLTLIEGINNDSPSSISNGAGKSSIFEALFWGLFGKTKRGLTGDAVVNRAVGKNCAVTIWFDDYYLMRTRQYGTMAPLGLYKSDGAGGWNDLTKGTVKETQALLDSIIRISPDVFSKISYFGQGDVNAFAELGDAGLKDVFEQALALTDLTRWKQEAQRRRQACEKDYAEKQVKLDKLGLEQAHVEEQIRAFEKAIKEAKEMWTTEIERLDRQIAATKEQIAELERTHESAVMDYREKAVVLHELKGKRARLIAQQKELDARYTAEITAMSSMKTSFEIKSKELEKMANDIREAPSKTGSECDACGREFSESDVHKAVHKMLGNLKVLGARVKDLKEAHRIKSAEVGNLKVLRDKLSAEIERLVGEMDSLECRKYEEVLNGLKAKMKDLLAQLNSDTLARDKLACKDFSYADDIKKLQHRLMTVEADILCLKAHLMDLSKQVTTASQLEEILGNAGIKSYIFDTVTPALNKAIDRFIKMLDDIDIEISTVTKLKSGEYREKFSITVDNHHGSADYKGNSGGEQQKVNLAIALGFNEVLRSMSENSVNVLFLDEPFESLDEGSSERVIDLCKLFADRDNVMLITHNPAIKDLIANVIRVEKSGRVATIKAA